MPRGIGASIGVNGHDRLRAAPAAPSAQRLLDLRRVPVRAADLVGGHRAHDLGRQQVAADGERPAPGGAGGGHDHDVARARPARPRAAGASARMAAVA